MAGVRDTPGHALPPATSLSVTSEGNHSGSERRGAPRVRVSFRARWQGAWATREGEIRDLSETGCFILTDDLVRAGETVMIEIRLPASGQITVWGVVVYQAEEVGFAVRFSNFMAEDDRCMLGWLVRAEAARAGRSGEEGDDGRS